MTKLYQDKDADLANLRGKTVAILGYGIQGRAQARNLHDSGVHVVVGLRSDSPSHKAVQGDGLRVETLENAVAKADVVMMLMPDEVQPEVYERLVAPCLRTGSTLCFAHGFNIHYRTIEPPKGVDVILLAPKAPGAAVREQFTKGSGVPALLAVHRDATGKARQVGLALAKGIGATRLGVLETTIAEETETDLFGEQAVLCGGMTELIRRGFETLVNGGYQPEIAYFEVLHELKLIVDLVQAGGIEHMWDSVSNTAEYGGRTRGPFLVNDDVAARMDGLLRAIRSGEFAKEWVSEYRAGLPKLSHRRQQEAEHEIERVGARVRALFESGKAKRSEEDAAWMTASPAQPRS